MASKKGNTDQVESVAPTTEGLTIDERMANLHADHVAMGARPADDTVPTTHVEPAPTEAETE